MNRTPGSDAHKARLAERLKLAKQRIHECSGDEAPRIARATDPTAPFPLTDIQQAYLVGRADDYELGGIGCHSYTEFELAALDVPRFVEALRRVVARHPMLRAVTIAEQQHVLADVPAISVPADDLRDLAPADVARSLAATRKAMSHRVFDPAQWPLFDFRISLLPDRVRVHAGFDIMMVDGSSLRLFSSELWRLYHDPATALEPLDLTFQEYVRHVTGLRGGPSWTRSKAYWSARQLPPAPVLPMRTGVNSFGPPVFVRRAARLSSTEWVALKRSGKELAVSPTALVLGAFAEVLQRWSENDAFSINLTVYQRRPFHPQVAHIIGNFTSVILFAVDRPNGDFAARVKAIHERLWNDLDHAEVSGIEVMRELSRKTAAQATPMAPVVFTSMIGVPDSGELAAAGVSTTFGVSQTPQVLLDCQAIELDGGIAFQWDAIDERFEPGVLDAMFVAFERLVRWVASGAALDGPLPPLFDTRRREALNAPTGHMPRLLHAGFLETAHRVPDAIAVVRGNERTTYGELLVRSGAVARLLDARPGIVAVMLDKSVDQVAAVLGILRAGGAYLPLSTTLPAARVRRLLELSGARVVLGHRVTLDAHELPPSVRACAIDAVPNGTPPVDPSTPADLAYVVFTSGSTGTPKGVMIRHEAATNTVEDVSERFGVLASDRVLSLSSLGFDLSVYDLFGLLAVGGTIVFPEDTRARDPEHWLELVVREGVTIWNTVPAMLEMLIDHSPPETRLGSLRLALLSGDWVPTSLPDRARAIAPGLSAISLGGATEAAIWSVYYAIGEVNPTWRSLPYGVPLRDQSLHVWDARLEDRPEMVAGDLYIGGEGVAEGYLHDPERTAAAFIERGGARYYRTGDRAAYLPDGNLRFLGRNDGQVKIRGHRIELGEVQYVLGNVGGVERCVAAVAGTDGARQLVAVVVPRTGVDRRALETLLAERAAAELPRYMVPERILLVSRIPLSENGKVDLGKLAEAPLAPNARPRAEGQLAELVRNLVRELLPDAPPDVDDLFAVGANSLHLVRLLARMRARFGVRLPLADVLVEPTVSALARRLDEARKGSADLPVPKSDPARTDFPLAPAQRGMWVLQRLDPGSVAYNTIDGFSLLGPLDVVALVASVEDVVARHEALRTTFAVDAAGHPFQRVGDAHPRITRLDASGAPSTFVTEAIARAAYQRWNLEAAPPFEAVLITIAPEEYLLLLAMHHIVCDGWSVAILVRDVWTTYRARTGGAPAALPELPFRYGELVEWSRARAALAAGKVEAWREMLADAPSGLALPQRTGARGERGPGRRRFILLPAETGAAIQRAAETSGVTVYTVVLAVFALALRRLTGQDDVVVGTPVSDRAHPAAEPVVGLFVNTLPIRIRVSGDGTFGELVQATQRTILRALDHADVPFEEIVRAVHGGRGAGQNPLFDAMFALQNTPDLPVAEGGVAVRHVPLEPPTAKFDFTLEMKETPLGFGGFVEYRPEILADDTVEGFIGCFERLAARVLMLDVAVDALAPGELPKVEAPEPPVALPVRGIAGLVLDQAARTPDAIALLDRGRPVAYRELVARCQSLARALVKRGVGPEVCVGVYGGCDAHVVEAVLAVLLAGGAYVPFAAEQSSARMVDNARHTAVRFILAAAADTVDLGIPTLAIEALRDEPGAALPAEISPDALAYVLFTSGSTGRPKAVAVTHRAIGARIAWACDARVLTADDRVLMNTSIGFDVSLCEIFEPLTSGATLVCDGTKRALAERIEAHAVTVLNTVPSVLRTLLPERARLTSLRQLNCGAETLDGALRDAVLGALDVTLHHFYGTTEAAVDSTRGTLRAGEDVHVGTPIAGAKVWILDRMGNECPAGVPGEIFLGGPGLARGYFGDSAATAERFLLCSASPCGERMYRTGDRGWKTARGELELLGRMDHQVKVRGMRIEPEEIRAAILGMREVRDAAVVALRRGEDTELAALVAAPPEIDAVALRRHLRARLPPGLVPSRIVVADALPALPSGKVDPVAVRSALDVAPGLTAAALAPRTAHELTIAELFATVLGEPILDVRADFFALGGHSLAAVRLAKLASDRLARPVSVVDVLEHSTVESLARHTAVAAMGGERTCVVLREGTRPAVFLVHPVGGEVACYVPLSRALATDAAVIGLRAIVPAPSVASLAETHLATIRATQPRGPYRIGGWSMGGIVGFEVARRLRAAGEVVTEVIAIDAHHVRLAAEETVDARQVFLRDLAGAARPAPPAGLRDDDALAWAVANDVLPAETGLGYFVHRLAIYCAGAAALAAWEPPDAPADLDVVYVAMSETRPDVAEVWRAWTRGAVRVATVPGGHYALLDRSGAAAVAAAIGRLA